MENIDSQIQSLQTLLTTICNGIKDKDAEFKVLNQTMQKKQEEIESYNKVSWIKKMNKQFEDSKKKITRLEKQVVKLKNKNKKLTTDNKKLSKIGKNKKNKPVESKDKLIVENNDVWGLCRWSTYIY